MKKPIKQGFWVLFVSILIPILFSSCVSNKKYTELEGARNDLSAKITEQQQRLNEGSIQNTQLQNQLTQTQNQLSIKEVELMSAEQKAHTAELELEYLKNSNTLLLDRLADLSVVSKTGVESIKKSLETLQERNQYIRELTNSVQRKDSLNLVLVMNLKRSLERFDDEDVTIEVKKGVVYVSLSDKMLFQSGSSEITTKAKEVLGKIASVVNDHNQLDILVEGHTDNVAIGKNLVGVKDNWDLSAQRAVAVVRVLQNDYQVNPVRMTAGARSKYLPKASNETAEGRSLNRRTEIIILPKLDEFFNLLTPQMIEKTDQGY